MKMPTTKFKRTKTIVSTATKIGAKKAFGLGKEPSYLKDRRLKR